jgi:formylglycine-generating enzyme required for sulfatase activity
VAALKRRVSQLKQFLRFPPRDVHAQEARIMQNAYEAALTEATRPEPPPPPPAAPAVPPWAAPLASRFQIDGAKEAGVPVAREIDLGNGQTMRFLFVPPGSFRTGEGAKREVTLTRGFYLGIHEVTREQWRAVMGSDPAGASAPEEEEEPGLAVTQVTWNEVVRFCAVLSERSSRAGSALRLRLPTDAEWEYACRAGTQSRYPWGNRFDEGSVWYWMNSGGRVRPVGSTKPNAWGFSDLLGNAMEWCADWHGPAQLEDATDPTGPGTGTVRVLRGGSWRSFKGQIHPLNRSCAAPGDFSVEIGFRLGMEP